MIPAPLSFADLRRIEIRGQVLSLIFLCPAAEPHLEHPHASTATSCPFPQVPGVHGVPTPKSPAPPCCHHEPPIPWRPEARHPRYPALFSCGGALASPHQGQTPRARRQAVRLPEAYRFEGSEVLIEKHGEEVVLKPLTPQKFGSFTEIARQMAEKFPEGGDFPEPPPRPRGHDRPILEF